MHVLGIDTSIRKANLKPIFLNSVLYLVYYELYVILEVEFANLQQKQSAHSFSLQNFNCVLESSWSQRSNGAKHISYGTSNLVNAEGFIEELSKLAGDR